ncbi:uncharacterized protein [Diadema antillarum]|uniref:uncharacterized protein n=1 Tax=Diadema antillarum TaxID=105358 RepID=UPI003A89ACF4
MYGEIKNFTKKFKPSLNVIKNKEGNTLTETTDVLDRWKEYCRELYEDEEVEEVGEENPLNWKIKTSEDSRLTPLRSEVEEAMKALKGGKSQGCDGIQAELLLAGGEAAVTLMNKLCVNIWQTGEWPVDWCRALTELRATSGCKIDCLSRLGSRSRLTFNGGIRPTVYDVTLGGEVSWRRGTTPIDWQDQAS